MDGTFDLSPTLYEQVFTIHAFVTDRSVPLLYVLMARKSAALYKKLFRLLKDEAASLNVQCDPKIVTTDFESGLIPAIRDEFPLAEHKGCYFHFTQAVKNYFIYLSFFF